MRDRQPTKALVAAVLLLLGSSLCAATDTFQKAYSLEGVSRVRVDNVNGEIRVETWDRNYVRVTATKEGTPSSLEHTLIRPSQRGDEIRIETVSNRRHHFFFFLFESGRVARVDYELHVPADMPLKLTTVNGRIHSGPRRAEMEAKTVNGTIELRAMQGEVRAETVNGRIRVETAGTSRDLHLGTVNGSISVELPPDASYRYDLACVNGHLEVGDRAVRARGIGGKHLDGDFGGGKASLRAHTVNGGVEIEFTGAAPAVHQESSKDGDWDHVEHMRPDPPTD